MTFARSLTGAVLRPEGVLFDIDGVLVTSWSAIDGAAAALRDVRELGLVRGFLTSTTSKTSHQIAQALWSAGLEVDHSEIVTAARLTAEYVRNVYPGAAVWVLNEGDLREDFERIDLVMTPETVKPDVIVIGGAGPSFTHDALSRVCSLMIGGVPVIAMHKSMSWAVSTSGIKVDAGFYVEGLKRVTGRDIVAVGKPSPRGFRAATEMMGLDASVVMMVGDDLHNDVLAAQTAGLRGVLVRTGKFRQDALDVVVRDEFGLIPDHVVDSVAQVPQLLSELTGRSCSLGQ